MAEKHKIDTQQKADIILDYLRLVLEEQIKRGAPVEIESINGEFQTIFLEDFKQPYKTIQTTPAQIKLTYSNTF